MCACPGVVEEQQQGVVAQGKAAGVGKMAKQCLDLVALEKVCFGWCGSFHGDRGDLLADAEHRRLASGDVLEQCVQRRQALVTGPHVVVPAILEVAEEAEDSLETQVLEVELGDPCSLLLGHETQEEADGVPVAAHRRRSQALGGDQVIDEEGVDQRPERPRAGHGCSPGQAVSAKASNRRFASVSSCGVMVR